MAQPLDVIIVGQALNDFGFVGAQNAIAGLGLNTFGFLWPCDAIWTCTDPAITTVWVDVPPVNPSTEVCLD